VLISPRDPLYSAIKLYRVDKYIDGS